MKLQASKLRTLFYRTPLVAASVFESSLEINRDIGTNKYV